MSNIKAQKGAHVAFLFSDINFESGACGQGYQTISNYDAYSAGKAAAWICLAGDNFVHEVGHNLGLAHTSNETYFKRYAAGRGTWAWVTMMAIQSTHGGAIKKQRYSNPDIKCDDIYYCGLSETADAVRFINETARTRFTKRH